MSQLLLTVSWNLRGIPVYFCSFWKQRTTRLRVLEWKGTVSAQKALQRPPRQRGIELQELTIETLKAEEPSLRSSGYSSVSIYGTDFTELILKGIMTVYVTCLVMRVLYFRNQIV